MPGALVFCDSPETEAPGLLRNSPTALTATVPRHCSHAGPRQTQALGTEHLVNLTCDCSHDKVLQSSSTCHAATPVLDKRGDSEVHDSL